MLHRLAYEAGDDLKVRRAEAGADRMRGFASFAYAARSWNRKRSIVSRLEVTPRDFDARYIVISLPLRPRARSSTARSSSAWVRPFRLSRISERKGSSRPVICGAA